MLKKGYCGIRERTKARKKDGGRGRKGGMQNERGGRNIGETESVVGRVERVEVSYMGRWRKGKER